MEHAVNRPTPARLLESQGKLGMLQKAPQATQCSHTSKVQQSSHGRPCSL